jgi:hypothetical protein
VAVDDGLFGPQVFQERSGIVGKRLRAVLRRRLIGASSTALVINDDAVIAGKLGDLEGLPDLTVTGGLADEKKRRAFPVHLVIELQISPL